MLSLLHSSLTRSPSPPCLVNEFKEETWQEQMRIRQELLEMTWPIRVRGTQWTAPKAAERTSYHPCKATFYPLWQVMEMKGGSQQLKKGKCCNHLQMMPQGQKVSLSLVPGKIMEQVLLEGVSENLREEKVTGNSLHWFTKGKSCLSNFVVFFDKMTRLVDKGRVVICF